MTIFFKISTLCSLLFLTGCVDGMINSVENDKAMGAKFSSALKNEYLKLAKKESDIYNDHVDARHFVIKAKQANAGAEVHPEFPADWNIGDKATAHMNSHRERLVFALQKGGRQISPGLAAKAQVSFDCWVLEVDEGWNKKEAKKCKATFKEKLRNLEAAVHEMSPIFIIWFNMNSSKITSKGDLEIKQIVKAARQMPQHQISVRGLTDGVGGRRFNLQLSQDRARTVKRAITSNGIAANRVGISIGMGEAPGTRQLEPNNRRVEVQLH